MIGAKKQPDKALKFDHALHVVDNGMDCLDCHSGIESAGQGQWLMPDHETCSACHSETEDPESCGMCHVDPDNPIAVVPIPGRYEGFSHKMHLDAGRECKDCHGEITTADPTPVVPMMQDCQSCHAVNNASLDCAVCHLGETPQPDDHLGLDWASAHGLEAAEGTAECAMCHSLASTSPFSAPPSIPSGNRGGEGVPSCEDCHQGTGVFGAGNSPHPPTWVFDHFTAADFGANCLACHETRSYCTDCHRVMIPAPHTFGPTFANSTDGGEHKTEFETFPESCLSCHDMGAQDPTCARCHQ